MNINIEARCPFFKQHYYKRGRKTGILCEGYKKPFHLLEFGTSLDIHNYAAEYCCNFKGMEHCERYQKLMHKYDKKVVSV